jgi:putative ABC transport system permease protein
LTGLRSVVRALVFRALLREPLRASLTVFGIAVGVAVLVAIQLSNESAMAGFEDSVDAVAGRANYQIVSEAALLDETLLASLSSIWAVDGKFAPVIDAEGILRPSGIPIRVLAVDLLSDLHFRDYRYASIAGAAGSSTGDTGLRESVTTYFELFRRDSIVLPESFAGAHALKIGDEIEIELGGRSARFVIRGILMPEGPATAFNGSIAILDIASAQASFGLQGKLSRVDLLIPEDRVEEIRASLESLIPEQARLERPSRRNDRVDRMLRAFRLNLFALAAVALLVGVFLVYNTVLMSILRRRRSIGIMRTLGVTRGQLLAAFVFEGGLFGVVGSAIGAGLGKLLADSMLAVVSRTINALYVATTPSSVALTPQVALSAIAIGTVVSMIASLQPALEASSTGPLDLIRPGLYQRVRTTSLRWLAAGAAAAFVLALLLTRTGPIAGIPVGGYASVLFVVTGFSLLAPLALFAITRSLALPLRRIVGIPGQLSTASMPASLRRVAVATAALSIATGMMVAVALMVGSFRETVDAWVAQTVKSDLWLRPARALSNAQTAVFPAEISDALDELEFVEAYDPFRGRELVYRDTMILVGSGDFDTALNHSDLPMVDPSSAASALTTAVETSGVLVSETFAYRFDVSTGDVILLPTAVGNLGFPVAGVYRDYSNDRGVVIMDRSVWIERYQDDAINTVAIFLREGVDPDTARIEIEKRLGAAFRAFATTNSTIRREVMRIFDQTFLVTWALLGVALVVAVLGIVNTLSAIIIERRAEIALLKVLGVSQSQIRVMLALESGMIGICSTILGVASGWILALILIHVINRQSFGWTIEFAPPMNVIILSVAATFVSTTIAGLIPSGTAHRIAISATLKAE